MPNEVLKFLNDTKEALPPAPLSAKDVHRELRSEYVEEIVSSKPGFVIRYGNLFFLAILFLLVAGCWFIRYPMIIKAAAKLTSINAPKPVNAVLGGKLVGLFASEGELVTKGVVLGQLESTANYDEIKQLAIELDSMQFLLNVNEEEKLARYFQNNFNQLGELQQAYQNLAQAFFVFQDYFNDGLYTKRKAMLTIDKANLSKLHHLLLQTKNIQEQDLMLTQKTFDANKSLNESKVISDFDYRNEQSKLLNKKLTLPQINASIISNENQQNEKEKELVELENTIRQQKSVFQQALFTFKSQLQEWQKKYLLIAPMAGKLTFASFIEVNQQLQANQTVCFINPENTQYYAEVVIPQANFGKAAKGQKVLLRFASYPYQEYGSITGTIEFISNISGEKGYLAKVAIANDLITNYNKKIYYRDGLTADAEVITKDMGLLERFYYSFVSNLKR